MAERQATVPRGDRDARLDLVARAADLLSAGQPAVRLIVGAGDDPEGFLEPAQRLHAALLDRFDDRPGSTWSSYPAWATR